MKTKQGTRIVLLFLLLYATGLTAQIQFFSEDFENPATHGFWNMNFTTMNPPPNFTNSWHIGTAINNGGDYSLYISNDGGLTPGFSVPSRMLVKRRFDGGDLLLAGNYELSFDWLSGITGGNHILHVAWVPANVVIDNSIEALLAGVDPPPSIVSRLLGDLSQPPSPTWMNLTSSGWQTSWFNLTSDGTPHYLVFVFRNINNTNTTLRGAVVDNIRIIPQGSCDVPTNIEVLGTAVDNSLTISWTGTADSYEVRAHNPFRDEWYEGATSDTTITFLGIEEGGHHVWVRAVCNGEPGRWVRQTFFVHFPERHCVDFLTLTNDNCFTGGFTTIDQPLGSGSGLIPSANQLHLRRRVDFGYYDSRSRHTIHWDINERDPQTGGNLQTVPDGAVASVRLGNWLSGAEAERIEYFFEVDSLSAGLLLLRYALVLEDGGHNEETQARFQLRIFRGNQLVGGNQPLPCGTATFVAVHHEGEAEWHQFGRVWWKDWTTIGINLREFHGETLRIQFTMRDCLPSGHFGYAYFVLECAGGELEGLACGVESNRFEAPEGFHYSWFRVEEDGTLTTIADNDSRLSENGRVLTVEPADTMFYRVNVIFPVRNTPGCYFILEATAMPRFPVAAFSHSVLADTCLNIVRFENTSHVVFSNRYRPNPNDTVVQPPTPIPIEDSFWDFGDGSTSRVHNPTHEFPIEGGTFHVTLRVEMSDGACDSIITIPITLQSRLPEQLDSIVRICVPPLVPFVLPDGTQIWTDSVHVHVEKDAVGCIIGITRFDIKFGGPTHMERHVTICSDRLPYYFDGENLTESGIYIREFTNEFNCANSTDTLHLTVIDAIRVDMLQFPVVVCEDDNEIRLYYKVQSGSFPIFYEIEFCDTGKAANLQDTTGVITNNEGVIEVDMPTDVLPGIYLANIAFFQLNEHCDNDTVPLRVEIRYSVEMLVQKWNDVIAIRDRGIVFSDFQWYKAGERLHGETRPYLYIRGNAELEFGTGYSVLLTRASDGVSVLTCEYFPTWSPIPFAAASLSPTVLQTNQTAILSLSQGADVFVYDAMGIRKSHVRIQDEGEHSLFVSNRSGYHIVRVLQDDGQQQVFRVLVK